MLSENAQKVNEWLKNNQSRLLLTGLVFVTIISAFGLGRLSVLWSEKPKIRIFEPQSASSTHDSTGRGGETDNPLPPTEKTSDSATAETAAFNAQGKYVASKSGAAYHYPWCPGAQKIKESNKIWFQTKQEAESKGYKPAANCPGL